MPTTPAAPLYLDHHATTPCDPRVVDAMLPCLLEDFGNPSSTQHAFGQRAAGRVDVARLQVAELIGCEPAEVIFTSGATEADNLALFGVVDAAVERGVRAPHVITQVTEHKAVLDACAELERRGTTVTYVPVEHDGRVDPAKVAAALRPTTVLVSIMVANNEIGTVQPVCEIVELCRNHGVLVHTDAAQALAHGDCRLSKLDVDLMSLSAHKAYGPKGIGVLYARRRRPRVRLAPRQFGGGHERGRRSGTLDVPSIVGFGAACQLITERQADGSAQKEAARLTTLRGRLLDGLRRNFPDLVVNGSLEHRLPNNLNVSLPETSAVDLISELQGVAISSGSACTANSTSDASYVLAALPGGRGRADGALRFGLGRSTIESEIDRAIHEVTRAAKVVNQRPKARVDVCEVA